jgi:hypothetical protein
MSTDGNQQVTVINIKRPKEGIVSDEHNYLIIGVADGVGILVIMICTICICSVFKKDGRKTETTDAIELQNV